MQTLTLQDHVDSRRKLIGYCWQIYVSQYQANFIVQDLRPEVHLKAEIVAFWEGRTQRIHGWFNIIDQIRDTIVTPIKAFVEDVWNRTMRPTIDAIVSSVRWALESSIEATRMAIQGAISTLDSYVRAISANLDQVRSRLQEVDKIVWLELQRFNVATRVDLGELGRAVTAWFSAEANRTVAEIHALKAKLGELSEGDRAFTTRAIESAAAWIVEGFRGAIMQLVEVARWVWNNVLVPAGQALYGAIHGAISALAGVITSFLSHVMGILKQFAPASPARAEGAGVSLMTTFLTAGAGLLGMTIAGELIHPLKQIGLGHIGAMLYDASGYRTIVGALVGPSVRAAIAIPYAYHMNAIFQPYVLDVTNAGRAWAMGYLKEGEFVQHLRWAGYSAAYDDYWKEMVDVDISLSHAIEAYGRGIMDDRMFNEALRVNAADFKWRDVWARLADRPLSPFLLIRTGESEIGDFETFYELAIDMGYGRKKAALVAKAILFAATARARSPLVSALLRNYAEGMLPTEAFRAILIKVGYSHQIVNIFVFAAEEIYKLDVKFEKVKSVRRAFVEGSIDEDAYIVQLLALNVRPEKIDIWLSDDTLRRKEPKERSKDEEIRAFGISIVISRFKEGYSTELDFRYEAALLGYTPKQIERYLILARLAYDYDYAKDAVEGLKRSYGLGIIDDKIFLEDVSAYIVRPEKAIQTLELERLKKLGRRPPRRTTT